MAFAAVISLKRTIHRLKNLINIPQITKCAYDVELNSLGSMLNELDKESSRSIERSVINELDAKIREAVWKLENVLESYHSLNLSPSQGLDEKGVEQEMNSFLKKVKMLREEYNTVLQQKPLPAEEDEALSLSAAVPPANNSTTVGLSDLSQNIINQLLEDTWHAVGPDMESDPRRVSVVGMAGIGKTHLAALIYHHPRIVQHLDVFVDFSSSDELKTFTMSVDPSLLLSFSCNNMPPF
ncbi:hypothetical protein C2S52_008077 [Perilla frutescens var. hirtella]|nr:hypothetical protein C2S52_008077 [Perilla frutescens var. hirtella]